MLESVKVLVTPSCLTLCDPMDCSHPGSSVNGISGKNTGVGNPSPRPNPGIEPESPALQAGSLLSEPPEKPQSSGWLLNSLSG